MLFLVACGVLWCADGPDAPAGIGAELPARGALLDGWLRSAPALFSGAAGPEHSWSLGGLARAGYFVDQRVLWSGVEQTFGAEAVLSPELRTTVGDWNLRFAGAVLLNLPMDGNLLNNAANRLYRSNLVPPAVEAFNLYAEAQLGDVTLSLGKRPTPFGKYPSQIFTNSFADAPFLRTDIVGFADVGAFARWAPGDWRFEAGVVNGGSGLDTNSGKGYVARIGRDTERTWFGVSSRADDGDGSEWQKRYRNATGFDAGIRFGPWWLGGEAVREQHGFRHFPTDDPLGLDLGRRSLYGRDVFFADERAVDGYAYWIGAGCDLERMHFEVNYGESRPERIGDPWHDAPVQRLLTKLAYRPAPRLELYSVFLLENRRPVPDYISNIRTYGFWAGSQYTF